MAIFPLKIQIVYHNVLYKFSTIIHILINLVLVPMIFFTNHPNSNPVRPFLILFDAGNKKNCFILFLFCEVNLNFFFLISLWLLNIKNFVFALSKVKLSFYYSTSVFAQGIILLRFLLKVYFHRQGYLNSRKNSLHS